MSVVHKLLSQMEERDAKDKAPVVAKPKVETKGETGRLLYQLPVDIANQFYAVKEYINIANSRREIKVLSFSSALSGDGTTNISSFVSYLLGGGVAHEKRLFKAVPEVKKIQGRQMKNLFTEQFSQEMNENSANIIPLDVEPEQQLSHYNEDVLLVDGNLEKPGLHKFFGLSQKNGLSELIENDLDWREIVKPVNDSNLKVITAGHSNRLSAELLSSEKFRDLVKSWRRQFKYVIFDTPAVLQTMNSLTFASVSDGVIFVLCSGQTPWDSAQEAKNRLLSANAHVLGVVMNKQASSYSVMKSHRF